MLLRSNKKVEKPIDVEKTMEELKQNYNLICQDTNENIEQKDIESIGNLVINGRYILKNPRSYRPQTEIIKNNIREKIESEQTSKWVDVNTNIETVFNIFDKDREYTIKSIKYECKKYGKTTPYYNLGLFVFLEPQKNDSNDDTSEKQLKMSYELQSNKSKAGKYDGWIKNTSKTYNDFLGQFKAARKATATKATASKATASKASVSKATVRNTRKRGRLPSPSTSPLSKRAKNGGKKTQKRKKTQKNRGGIKVQDQKFVNDKKKNIQEKVATANLFGYRRSPERNPKNMIPVDPHGIIPFQSNFNQQIEDEGNYKDAKEAGLTFN